MDNLFRCYVCNQNLKAEMFCADSTRKSGLMSKCRLCSLARQRPSHAHRQKTYEEKHPERQAARIAVQKALSSGFLLKLPCEKCGNIKSFAHHPNYSKPLDVEWLCHIHHIEAHYGKLPIRERLLNEQRK